MPIDATQPYDDQNVFAKILRGEIPNRTVYEDQWALAFHDINPQAPVHVLVIPKGPYVTYDHFAAEASGEEIVDFHRTAASVCAMLGIAPGQGYRAITNAGEHGMQEVPHYHLHILGGKVMGRLVGG
jgi:histidine triad (HIT) family protein